MKRYLLFLLDGKFLSLLFNKQWIPVFLYRKLFILNSYYGIKNLKLKNGFFKFQDKLSNKLFSWSFPESLRTRGRRCYLKGLSSRGKLLAEQYFISEIKFSEEDAIIDCGANFGDLYLYLFLQNIRLNYFAFEPGFLEYSTLKENLNNNPSKIESKTFKKALGNINGQMELYYSPKHGDSSLIPMSINENSYKVEVLTLDTFLDSVNLNQKKIKLLKLEAEGFEPEILQGCAKNIKNIEYIAADLGPERGAKNECTLVEVTNFLVSNGFELLNFYHTRTTILYKNKFLSF